MKQITITTAILLSVKSFADHQFSIYDITKNIRENLNDGEYELRIFGDRINHDAVKLHFEELVENGFLANYSMKYSNGYRVFKLTSSIKANTPVVSTPAPSTTIPSDVQLIIYKYLKGRDPVTMKQIQSRLKGYTYTCQEIKDFLNAIDLIDTSSIANSPSKIKTVSIP